MIRRISIMKKLLSISQLYENNNLKFDFFQANSDHSDIVSRRMGFIPLPLGVLMIRVISTAIKSNSKGFLVVCFLAYCCLFTFR